MFTIQKITLLSSALLLFAIQSATAQAVPACKTFREIYGSSTKPGGQMVCENMWNNAFKYEKDETKGYNMWWFDNTNPNNAVTDTLSAAKATLFDGKGHEDAAANGDFGTDQCHLDYFHKDAPTSEANAFCHPWNNKPSCCKAATVKDSATIMEAYGKEYHWDRCGRLSPQCEAFFIQEACFYECEPNAGLWRKHSKNIFDTDGTDAEGNAKVTIGNADDHNAWQMEGMPIKASYCDAWYTACIDDKFCASDGGDFFSCAKEYIEVDESSKGLAPHIVAAIVVPIIVAVAAIALFLRMWSKERAGEPMFMPIDRQDARAKQSGMPMQTQAMQPQGIQSMQHQGMPPQGMHMQA